MSIIQNKPMTITEEELKELKDLQQAKQSLIYALGELEYEKLRLDAQKQTLELQFNQVVQGEYEISQRISEKYGDNKIDLKKIPFYSAINIYWVCSKNSNHKWKYPVNLRARQKKLVCPFCTNRKWCCSTSNCCRDTRMVREQYWRRVGSNFL
jgi:5-hydroxyisourate hydrolase-like protein (transthyretin family)